MLKFNHGLERILWNHLNICKSAFLFIFNTRRKSAKTLFRECCTIHIHTHIYSIFVALCLLLINIQVWIFATKASHAKLLSKWRAFCMRRNFLISHFPPFLFFLELIRRKLFPNFYSCSNNNSTKKNKLGDNKSHRNLHEFGWNFFMYFLASIRPSSNEIALFNMHIFRTCCRQQCWFV